MTSAGSMQQFIAGLKSKSEDVRLKAARDLHHYVSYLSRYLSRMSLLLLLMLLLLLVVVVVQVTSELREAAQEEMIGFVDDLNHHIFDMVSSSDANEKKGGILAIVSLLGVDVGNSNARMSRFANYLRNLLPSQDVVVMELAARAVGKLTQVRPTSTTRQPTETRRNEPLLIT